MPKPANAPLPGNRGSEDTRNIYENEQTFRALIENGVDIINLLDESFRVLYRSPSAERVGGWTDDEILGSDGRTRIHPDDMGCIKEYIGDLLENPGKSVCTKFRYLHKDGHYFWLEGVATNLLHNKNVKAIVFNYRDISERVRNETALKEERDKFAKVAATVPGLIYSFCLKPDGSFCFPFASNSIEDILGVSHDMVKDDLSIILNSSHQQDKELVISSIIESAKTMQPWKLEFRYRHPIKGLVWLEGHSIPSVEPGGSIIWYGTISDITERKLSEEKLLTQGARLKTLSDNLPGIMIYQLAGNSFSNRKFTYLSNAVTEITGKTPEEVTDNPSLLYNTILEEDLPGLIAAETESYNNVSLFNAEVRCRTYKGDIRWLNMISMPRKLNDGQIVWDGFHIDTTERKKAEEKLRLDVTLLNAVGQSVIVTDPLGIIVYWNAAAEKIFGWKPDEALGRKITELIPTEKNSARGKQIMGELQKGKSWSGEFMVRRKDGHSFPVFVTDSPVFDKAGNLNGIIGVSADISEQKKEQRKIHTMERRILNQKLKQQKEIARAIIIAQEKERNHLGQELHDNINQILAGIKIHLSIAAKKSRKFLEAVQYPMELIDSSIEEIRLLSRGMVTSLINVDLETMVRKLLKNLDQKTNIKTGFTCLLENDSLPDDLKLNIYRIIQEQLTNIHKHSNATNADIFINSKSSMINIMITDDGAGFNMKAGKRGIGLENMKNRVESFNGKIQIKSSPGNGCRISISIPLQNPKQVIK